MHKRSWKIRKLLLLLILSIGCASSGNLPKTASLSDETLNLWKDPYRVELSRFVQEVTEKSSPHYVPPEQRIAVFDLDGTLITERPQYFEVALALHFLKQDLKKHPTLASEPIFQAVHHNDSNYIEEHGKEIMSAYFKGRTERKVRDEVAEFYHNGINEKFHCRHDQLVFEPMRQLLAYLKKRDFQVYIVSTTSLPIVREVAVESFQLTPDKVIGSVPTMKLSETASLGETVYGDDYFPPYNEDEGKALRIMERIGTTPMLVFGNSGGDLGMMRLTDSNQKEHEILLLDHDDSREAVYHKEKMLQLAIERKWTVVPISQAFQGDIFADCPAPSIP